jgi:hypothetical protein
MSAPTQQDSTFHVEFQSATFDAGQQFKQHAYQHALQLAQVANLDALSLVSVPNASP